MATFEHYALVIPDDFEQVTVEHSVTGVPDKVICTFGVLDSVGDLEDVDREAIRDAWATEIVEPLFSTATTFDRIYFSDQGGVVWEDFPDVDGLQINAPAPISNAILVEKRTGTSGRRNRGRMFLPAVYEDTVGISGEITSGYRAGVQTAVDAFLTAVETALGGTPGGMYILHSKGWDGAVEPADPGNAPAPTVVTSLFVKSKIGTQRRRLR